MKKTLLFIFLLFTFQGKSQNQNWIDLLLQQYLSQPNQQVRNSNLVDVIRALRNNGIATKIDSCSRAAGNDTVWNYIGGIKYSFYLDSIGGGAGAPIYPNARIPYGNGVTAGGTTDANFLRNTNAFSAKSVDPTDAGSYSKIAITGPNGADTYFQKASSNGAVAQVDASKRIDNSNLQMAITVVDSLGTVNEIGLHPDSVYVNVGSNNTRLTIDGAAQVYVLNKLGGTGNKVVGVRNNGMLVDTTIASSANITIDSSIFVTKNGNDATGVVYDFTHPFLTVAAAIHAAIVANAKSNTVIVYPGVYIESIPLSLFDNLNFNFIGQGTLQLVTGNHNPLWRDSTSNDTTIIQASGWTFQGRAVSQDIFNLSHAGTVVTATVGSTITTGSSVGTLQNGNTLNFKGDVAHSTGIVSSLALFFALNGTLNLDIGLIQSDSGKNNTIEFDHSQINIKAKKIFTNGDGVSSILGDDGDSTDVVNIECGDIINGNAWTIWVLGKSQHVYISANTITGSGTCTVVASENIQMTLKGATIRNTRTSSPYGILHTETEGTLTVIACKTIRTSTSGADLKTDGTGGFGNNYARIYVIGCSFDIMHTNIGIANSIQQWNGTDFIPLPKILNSVSTDSILNSTVEQDTINFATFPRCYIKNSIIKNSTITFTDSDQVIDGQIWINDFCVSCNVQRDNYTAVTDPTVSNDTSQGYAAGSEWLNRSDPDSNLWTLYKCLDSSIGAAIWSRVTFH